MEKRKEYIGVRYYYGSSHSGREWSLSRFEAYSLAKKDSTLNPGTHVTDGSDWDGEYYYARGYPQKRK